MKFSTRQTINLIFFIFLTKTAFLHAHNYLNGGCKNHCKESVQPTTIEKKLNYLNDQNQVKDNYSCLNKSLCRG